MVSDSGPRSQEPKPAEIPTANLLSKKDWHEAVDQAVPEALANGRPLSILFIDVNYFKHVNDTFGHDVGDVVINELGKTVNELASKLRTHKTDRRVETDLATVHPSETPFVDELEAAELLPGHVGGDEFAIMCHTDAEGAQNAAERLRSEFETYLGRPENSGFRDLGIGLAIGLAELKPGMDASALLREADEAMYKNKIEQIPRLTKPQKAALYLARYTLKAAGIRLRDVPKYWPTIEKLPK